MREAFYINQNEEQLFAIYEPPKKLSRERAILLCHSIGHEYLRSYRSFKLLGEKLSAQGFHCMRFDYRGTGDSFGNFEDYNLSDWQNDIARTIDELKAVSGQKTVSIIGLRLGAALAARVATERKDVDTVYCWDPIFDGKNYLQNLHSIHQSMLQDLMRFPKAREPESCKPGELVGYKYNETLMNDIALLDDQHYRLISREKLRIINSLPSNEVKAFLLSLDNSNEIAVKDFEHQVQWDNVLKLQTTFLPRDIIDYLVSEHMS